MKRIALVTAVASVAVAAAAVQSATAGTSNTLRSGPRAVPNPQPAQLVAPAEGAKRQRVARSLRIDDPTQYGEWVADIERPAEQYRARYHERLAEARDLLD